MLNELRWKLVAIYDDIKAWFQRLTKGYADRESWDFFSYCARWSVPRLKQLRKHNHGYPDGMTLEQWDEILGKIIFAMECCSNDDWSFQEGWKEKAEKVDEGCKLFGEYFQALWD